MKIIMPVVDNGCARNTIAKGFHNTDYACIYDCENESYEWLSTAEISSKPGNLSLALKQRGVYTIISNQMPLMALGLFVESGLKVLKSKGNIVQENIKLYIEEKLEPLTRQSAFSDDTCTSSCGTCSASCN